MKMNIETKHLKLVTAIAHRGGLTRASEDLNLSQPALSQQLGALERTLGMPLFHRVGKRMTLTSAGETLLAEGQAVLDRMDALRERLCGLRNGKATQIRLGTQCYTAFHWLPSAIAGYAKAAPHVDVRIIGEATHAAEAALLEGKLDVAILYREPRDARIRSFPLFEDDLVLVVSPAHRLASRGFVGPEDLRDEDVYTYLVPSGQDSALTEFLAAAEPRRVTQLHWAGAIAEFARAGLGVGLLAPWSVKGSLTSGDLVAVRLGADGIHRRWTASMVVPAFANPDIRAFVEFLRQAA